MAGGKLATVRIGDESELLANYILEHIAFVTRVPREEDVGIDFFCLLFKSKEKMIEAGPSFSVQIKSSETPIVYSKPHAVNWIASQEQPLFVGIVDVKRGVLNLYSTWRMLNAFLLKTPPRVRLIPGSQESGKYICFTKNKSRVDIFLGKPVVKLGFADLTDLKRVDQCRQVLKEWIQLDRLNLVRREAKLFWVVGPRNYHTNEKISSIPIREFEQSFFWNPRNINFTMDNLIRACVAVIKDVESHPSPSAGLTALKRELEGFLISNGSRLAEWHRRLISSYTGLKFR